MEKNNKKTVNSQGELTLEKAREYALNDIKVSIGFLNFILSKPEIIEMAAKEMLLLQEQLKVKAVSEKPE